MVKMHKLNIIFFSPLAFLLFHPYNNLLLFPPQHLFIGQQAICCKVHAIILNLYKSVKPIKMEPHFVTHI
jgi:hypothetical protein